MNNFDTRCAFFEQGKGRTRFSRPYFLDLGIKVLRQMTDRFLVSKNLASQILRTTFEETPWHSYHT